MNPTLNPMLNKASERGDYFCAIVCTELAHLGPNTMISPAERDTILLKTRGPQNVRRTVAPNVVGSNPMAHPTSLWESGLSNDRQPSWRQPKIPLGPRHFR